MVYSGIGHQDSSNDCIIHFDSWVMKFTASELLNMLALAKRKGLVKPARMGFFMGLYWYTIKLMYNQQYEKHVSASLLQFAEIDGAVKLEKPLQERTLWPFQSYFWRTLLLDPDNVEFLDSKTSKESIQAMVCLPFDQEMSRKKE